MIHGISEKGVDDYKKREEAIRRRLSSAAKSSDSEILKNQAKKENRDRPEIQDMTRMAHMLLEEGLEMFRSGDMTFGEMADDLHRAMTALGQHKEPKDVKERKTDKSENLDKT